MKAYAVAGLVLAGAVGVGGVGFGAAFGTARAATSSTIPPGTIHGCVVGTGRTLSDVYTNPTAGTTCSSGTFQVIWNVKGPQGPVGPAGSAGPSTAGPSGLDALTVTNEQTASYPDGTSVDVQCPSSHPYVISGGGFINDNSASLRDSYPVVPGPGGQFPQGWEVAVTFPAAITGGGVTSASVTAYAVCTK